MFEAAAYYSNNGHSSAPRNMNTYYLAPVYTVAAATRFPKVDDTYFRLLPSGQTTVTVEEGAMLAAVFAEDGELLARPASGFGNLGCPRQPS